MLLYQVKRPLIHLNKEAHTRCCPKYFHKNQIALHQFVNSPEVPGLHTKELVLLPLQHWHTGGRFPHSHHCFLCASLLLWTKSISVQQKMQLPDLPQTAPRWLPGDRFYWKSAMRISIYLGEITYVFIKFKYIMDFWDFLFSSTFFRQQTRHDPPSRKISRPPMQ